MLRAPVLEAMMAPDAQQHQHLKRAPRQWPERSASAQEVGMLEVGWKPRHHTRFTGADRLALTSVNKLWDGELVPLVRGYVKGPLSRGRGLGPVRRPPLLLRMTVGHLLLHM